MAAFARLNKKALIKNAAKHRSRIVGGRYLRAVVVVTEKDVIFIIDYCDDIDW